jgi:hypothetical protein
MTPSRPSVLLRPARLEDEADLARLAELDSRSLPPGPHLVAVRGEDIQAALSLYSGELVANPFVRTAELCELLRLHGASLRRDAAPRSRRVLRPSPMVVPG